MPAIEGDVKLLINIYKPKNVSVAELLAPSVYPYHFLGERIKRGATFKANCIFFFFKKDKIRSKSV